MSDEQLREDELVSAYLDAEATPAEIAEVEGSDALRARVEQLRAVRDAVAEPVVPLSADLRDDLIGAALQVADAEAAARVEAKVVPLRRPQRLLLAMAAAVVVLAAVVGTGLIASRGGDDYATMASDATADAMAGASAEMAAEPPADAAPMDEEEPMPEMDMEAADEAMAEEPMAEVEPMEEASAAEAEAALEAAMAAEAVLAPAATTTVAAGQAVPEVPGTDEGQHSESTDDGVEPDDGTDTEVVDLGTLETLGSLYDTIGASWSAALEDGATADPGACSAEVHEQALELSADEPRSFVATVGTEDPRTFDARFARRADGTALIIHAAPPDCEIGTHELSGSERE